MSTVVSNRPQKRSTSCASSSRRRRYRSTADARPGLFVHHRHPAASSGGSAATKSGTATSLTDFGGIDALVKAAKAEGTINVVALPDDWANYGAIKKPSRSSTASP